MSLKDFIKNNLIDTGEDEHPKPVTIAKSIPPTKSTGITYQDSSQPATKYVTVDSAFRKHFLDLMQQSNLPGPDYYEFIDAKNKLAPNVSVESICYQTAFSVLQGMGLTKEKITSSAQTYIGIVDKELEGFNATFQNTYKAQVDDNNSAISQNIISIDKCVNMLLKASCVDELKTLVVVSHDLSNAVAIADTVYVLAKEKDKPGGTIVRTIDLIERDLAWHKDVKEMPEFKETIKEIKSLL